MCINVYLLSLQLAHKILEGRDHLYFCHLAQCLARSKNSNDLLSTWVNGNMVGYDLRLWSQVVLAWPIVGWVTLVKALLALGSAFVKWREYFLYCVLMINWKMHRKHSEHCLAHREPTIRSTHSTNIYSRHGKKLNWDKISIPSSSLYTTFCLMALSTKMLWPNPLFFPVPKHCQGLSFLGNSVHAIPFPSPALQWAGFCHIFWVTALLSLTKENSSVHLHLFPSQHLTKIGDGSFA